MSKHHKETLNFTGSGYYGALSNEDGYGGFNYVYLEYLNATYWENIATNWCDTGFQNVTADSKDAVGCAVVYEDGLMESTNLKDSFTLKSMIAASAWNTGAVWDIKSYSYSNGSMSLKASDSMTISQTAQTINFAKLGGKGDFTDISAVSFVLQSAGGAGNTCTYGGPLYAFELAFDHLKVHWNGKSPAGHGEMRGGHIMPHVHHAVAASLFVARNETAHLGSNDHSSGAANHESGGGYHSMLTSLDTALGHNPGHELTSLFALPQLEHFGT